MIDLSQTLTNLIDQIRSETCSGCKVNAALVKLQDLRDSLDTPEKIAQPSEPATNKKSLSGRSKPAKPQTAKDLKRKIHARNGKLGGTQELIIQYLAAHPGSKAIDMAAALKMDRSAIYWNLRQLGKRVKNVGSTQKSVWYLKDHLVDEPTKDKTVPAPPVDDEDDDEDIKIHECDRCHEQFAGRDRLERHIQMVHKKGAA